MEHNPLEDKIIGIFGSLKNFSKATDLSVPTICQVITGEDVLSPEEKIRFENALNI